MDAPEPKSYPLRGLNGQLLTASLFLEQAVQSGQGTITPPFTFQSYRAVEGYIDARGTFLECKDPTGVVWATKYLEGTNHLLELLSCSWFLEEYDSWIAELDRVIQAEALLKVRQIASSSSPAAFQAAKYLADQGWKKSGKGRGRPSKSEVQGELKRIADLAASQESDHARVLAGRKANLTVVK